MNRSEHMKQVNEQRRAGKTAMSAGIGESRIFAAPEGTFDPPGILDCHVGGAPITGFPPEVQVRILYAQTDEGIAAAVKSTINAVPGVQILSDPLDKVILERRDFRESNLESWEAPDPMKDLADRYVAPGMRPKFLSQDNIARGKTGGFQPVIDEKGNPVRLGTLTLAEMPVARVVKRNEHYAEKGNAQLREIQEQFHTEQERFQRDAGVRPSAPRPGHPDQDTGLHSTRGNSAELE